MSVGGLDGLEPPHDLQAEQVVLGGMLLNPSAIEMVLGRLDAGDLYDPRHAQLFTLIVSEYQAGRPTSLPAILGRLTDTGLFRLIDGGELHRLINAVPVVANVGFFAERVRQMGIRRRLLVAATRVARMAAAERELPAETCVEAARLEFDRIEVSTAHEAHSPVSIADFLATAAEHDWLIPGLIERGERLLLTAPEGFGKSTLVRQLVVCVAAGHHPFDWTEVAPRSVLVVDGENPVSLNQRRYRPLVLAAQQRGWRQDNLWIVCRPDGLDLTRPGDEAWLVRQVRQLRPDLLVVGPVYKLHNDDPNDEQVARRITKVFDHLRGKFGCAVVMEAHSPHGNGVGPRPVRPFGASLWRRWPDFGLGLRPAARTDPRRRLAEVVRWKARDERDWPAAVRAGADWPWVGMSREQFDFEVGQGGSP